MTDFAFDGCPDSVVIIDCTFSRSIGTQEILEACRAVAFCTVERNFWGILFIPIVKSFGSAVRMTGIFPETLGFDLFHQSSDIKIAVRGDQGKTSDKEYKQNAYNLWFFEHGILLP
ncbi:hypothetical protein ES703_100919 [subsurface metagenome]